MVSVNQRQKSFIHNISHISLLKTKCVSWVWVKPKSLKCFISESLYLWFVQRHKNELFQMKISNRFLKKEKKNNFLVSLSELIKKSNSTAKAYSGQQILFLLISCFFCRWVYLSIGNRQEKNPVLKKDIQLRLFSHKYMS